MNSDQNALTVRNDKGQFAAGHAAGLRRGAPNKLTKVIQVQIEERLRTGGPAANPLIVMHDIMTDQRHSPALRLQAAFKLAQFLAPRLLALDEPSQEASERDVRVSVALMKLFSADVPERKAIAYEERGDG